MWKQIFFSKKICVLMNLFLVLLGSNSTELLWFKGGWFPLFLQLRGKKCLLILGDFPKCWLLHYYIYIRNILLFYTYKWIFYNFLMCTLIIRFMKNLWDNLNLFKFVCAMYPYIFENYDWIIFVSILNELFMWVSCICFENLWQVVIRSLVWYLVLSKG